MWEGAIVALCAAPIIALLVHVNIKLTLATARQMHRGNTLLIHMMVKEVFESDATTTKECAALLRKSEDVVFRTTLLKEYGDFKIIADDLFEQKKIDRGYKEMMHRFADCLYESVENSVLSFQCLLIRNEDFPTIRIEQTSSGAGTAIVDLGVFALNDRIVERCRKIDH